MADLRGLIQSARDAVWAVFRESYDAARDWTEVSCVGTAWCFADKRFLAAAHVFNEGKPRDPKASFKLARVTGLNRVGVLQLVGIKQVLYEDLALDFAVLEAVGLQEGVPQIPLTFDTAEDGTQVVTIGYPTPSNVSVVPDGKVRTIL